MNECCIKLIRGIKDINGGTAVYCTCGRIFGYQEFYDKKTLLN